MTVAPAPHEPARVSRQAQKAATRRALLGVAVDLLIEKGVAGVSTLEVQTRAGVSRGALLHHFPSRAELLSATVTELVMLNEAALWREKAGQGDSGDPLADAILTLTRAASTPSYVAELELWAVSRTDAALRTTLRDAERRALGERERVMNELFAPLKDAPGCEAVKALSAEFARGLALSSLLRGDGRKTRSLVDGWIRAARLMIESEQSPRGDTP